MSKALYNHQAARRILQKERHFFLYLYFEALLIPCAAVRVDAEPT